MEVQVEPYKKGTSVFCLIDDDKPQPYLGNIVDHRADIEGFALSINLTNPGDDIFSPIVRQEYLVTVTDITCKCCKGGHPTRIFNHKKVVAGHWCVCDRPFIPDMFNGNIRECLKMQCSHEKCTNSAVNFSSHSFDLYSTNIVSFLVADKFKDAKPMCSKHLVDCHRPPLDQCICEGSPLRLQFETNLLSLRNHISILTVEKRPFVLELLLSMHRLGIPKPIVWMILLMVS